MKNFVMTLNDVFSRVNIMLLNSTDVSWHDMKEQKSGK